VLDLFQRSPASVGVSGDAGIADLHEVGEAVFDPQAVHAVGLELDFHDVARLAGVDPAELDRARTSKRGDRTLTQWTRTWRGAAVEGDQVALVAVGGRIAGVWVQLTPIGLDTRRNFVVDTLTSPDRLVIDVML
jgi:hypothetical protein